MSTPRYDTLNQQLKVLRVTDEDDKYFYWNNPSSSLVSQYLNQGNILRDRFVLSNLPL